MNEEKQERVTLTPEQAIALLSDGEYVHTFRSTAFCLIGADWKREKLIKAIRTNRCEIGGEMCCRMNHGLVVWTGNEPLFVECRKRAEYSRFSPQETTE